MRYIDTKLELYRIFSEVVKTGSFSAAAKELYISQPAVSQAVRQLEESLKTPLFVRGARGVRLTREGEVLSGYIDSALGLIDAGEMRMKKLSALEEGELRIGAGDTTAKEYLLPIVGEFHRRYPEISVRLTNRTSTETLALLKDGGIDLGFVNMPLDDDDVIFEECLEVHDVFIAGEAFSELKDKTVTLAQLSNYPLIMLERASNSRCWVDEHFASNGITPQVAIELGAHGLLADYAGIGLGIACCIKEFSQKDLMRDDLFEISLTPPVPPRSMAACRLRNVEQPRSATKFLEIVYEMKGE